MFYFVSACHRRDLQIVAEVYVQDLPKFFKRPPATVAAELLVVLVVISRDYKRSRIWKLPTCLMFEPPSFSLLSENDDATISLDEAACFSRGSLCVDSEVFFGVQNLRGFHMGSSSVNVAADGFIDLDLAMQDEILNLGENATKQKNQWARNKFDKWRSLSGLDCSIPLEKLDLRELNDMLSRFLLVVSKKGGALFPSDSLMGMYRCFGRILKKEQDLRIASTGITEVPFDIGRNPIFKSSQNALLAAMRRSVAGGVCKDRKKAPMIGVCMEEEMLKDIDFSIMHNRGCQRRFAFFCLLHFAVRGGFELYKLERSMFSRGNDELGDYVRFNERTSKNYKVDMTHYQPEHFRPPVTVRDADVVSTYDQLMRHMPDLVAGDKNLPFLFLQPINNPRCQVWYSRNRQSLKSLSLLVKSMSFGSMEGNFCNKSLRNTSITRMSLAQVPPEVGMLVTGHKRPSSYQKYDLSSEVRMAAAQEIISSPYDEGGRLKTYPQVLEDKFSAFIDNIEGKKRLQCPISAPTSNVVSKSSSSSSLCGAGVIDAASLSSKFSSSCASRISGTLLPTAHVQSTVFGSIGNGSSSISESMKVVMSGGFANVQSTGCGNSGCGTNSNKSGFCAGVGIYQSTGCGSSGCGTNSSKSEFSTGIEGAAIQGGASKTSDGFIPYKLGDDIPFDEQILNQLPPESARALGLPTRGLSFFPGCSMNNCVVNVYVGKENVPTVPFPK